MPLGLTAPASSRDVATKKADYSVYYLGYKVLVYLKINR